MPIHCDCISMHVSHAVTVNYNCNMPYRLRLACLHVTTILEICSHDRGICSHWGATASLKFTLPRSQPEPHSLVLLGVAVQTTDVLVVVGTRLNCAPATMPDSMWATVTLGLLEHSLRLAGLLRCRVGFCGAVKAVDRTVLPLAPQLFGIEIAVRLSLKGTHPVRGLLQLTLIAWSARTAHHNMARHSQVHHSSTRGSPRRSCLVRG